MATEEQKVKNKARVLELTLAGVTEAFWDVLGEGAYGSIHEIGHELLPIMEKEMGLEVVGESPLDALQEMGRIAEDEFGMAEESEVTQTDNVLTFKVKNHAFYGLLKRLSEFGIEKLFIEPHLTTASAMLDKIGVKAISDITLWPEEKGIIITFEII